MSCLRNQFVDGVKQHCKITWFLIGQGSAIPNTVNDHFSFMYFVYSDIKRLMHIGLDINASRIRNQLRLDDRLK